MYSTFIKLVSLFQDENGILRTASHFYDPYHPVFKVMFSESNGEEKFPPAPFNEFKWLDFMRNIGLNHVVTSDMFVNFCREVAQQAKKETNSVTFERVSLFY